MSANRPIEAFEEEIEKYENSMFGLMLYQETSPMPVKVLQKISYKNMLRRGDKAIEEAKSILKDAKEGNDVSDRIKSFEWPVILKDMMYRLDILLECYNELFPGRPREKRLSREEIITLRNAAVDRA